MVEIWQPIIRPIALPPELGDALEADQSHQTAQRFDLFVEPTQPLRPGKFILRIVG